jgi:hypothetical protein
MTLFVLGLISCQVRLDRPDTAVQAGRSNFRPLSPAKPGGKTIMR